MTWLIGLALKFGVPTRFAKPAVIAALIVLFVLALGVGKCAYDRSVIEKHEAKQEAATAKADRKADNHAAEQRRVDDARAADERHEVKEAIDEAKSSGADPRAAYYKCVAMQQRARRERKPSPDC